MKEENNLNIIIFFFIKKKTETCHSFVYIVEKLTRRYWGKKSIPTCRTKPICQKSWYISSSEKDSLTEITEVDAYIYLYLSPVDLISVYKTNETAKELISSVWFMKLYVTTWLKKLNEYGKPDIWQYRKILTRSCGWNTPSHLAYIYHLF